MVELMNNETSFITLQQAHSKEAKQIMIKGKFNVNYRSDGLSVKGAEVLKHIVLVVTRGDNYQSIAPFEHVIVFEDDVSFTKEGCAGSFNFNVFEKIGFDGKGDFYIMCSLGSVTSNIILSVLDKS